MARPTALVVEDSFMVLMGLEALLEQHGVEIVGTAATVAQALALAASTTPDCAILDVNLDGEMIFPVADLLIGRGVPVIITTGYSPRETLPARFAAVPTLQKPYEARALLSMVDDVLAASGRSAAPIDQ